MKMHATAHLRLREHIFDLQQKFYREFAPKGRHAPSRAALYRTASHADNLLILMLHHLYQFKAWQTKKWPKVRSGVVLTN